MSKENNDIERINEQIRSILDEEKGIYNDTETELFDEGDEVLEEEIEEKESFDDNTKETTKKLDKIEDIPDTSESLKEEEDENKDSNKEEVVESSEVVVENSVNKPSNEVEPKSSKSVKKNKKKFIIILLVVVVLLAVILFIIFNKKDDKKNVVEKDDSLSKSEQKEIINNYGDAIKSVIVDYLEKQKVLLNYEDAIKLIEFDYDVICSEHEIYENGDLYLNSCKIDSKKTSCSYGEKKEKQEEVVEDDDSIKVYVSKSNKKAILNKPSNEDDYDIYSFKIDGGYSDLTLLKEYDSEYVFFYDDDMNVQMVNYKTGKKALSPLKYTSILPIKVEGSYSNIVAVLINDKWGIYNVDTRERLVSHKYESVTPVLYIGTSGPPLYIDALENGKIAVIEDEKIGVINYNTGDEVIPVRYKYMLKSGDYLWVTDVKNNGHIFDYSGEEYLNEKYKKLYGIVNGMYTLVKDEDDTIKLIKLGSKILYDYGELKVGDINYSIENNKKITFQFYKTNSKDLDNCVDVIYDLSTKTGEVKAVSCGGIG